MKRKLIAIASLSLTAALALALVPDKGQAQPEAIAIQPENALDRSIETLFAGENMGQTRALVVIKDGQIIAERYAPGFGSDTKLIAWSMSKTITAVLTGLMVADGKLALDEPAPVPAWQRTGDPRGEITLRQLLHMSSGLEHIENGDPVYDSDTVRMLFTDGAGDMAGYAEAKPLAARPDELYNYSSATSVIIADILTRALTSSENPQVRRDAMLSYIRGRLIEPLGMDSLTPEFDAKGTMIGGSIMHATARDFAKFGEFLRNRGVVDGQRILPESWIEFMETSSPTDPGYGGHLWLNKPRAPGLTKVLWPDRGSADIIACLGHQGQHIVVSPSQNVTVVRLGKSTDEQNVQVRLALATLMSRL